MKPVSLVHYGDIGLSANLDQAMSLQKKKEKTTKIHAKTHTHTSLGLTGPFCIWEEFLMNICWIIKNQPF